MTVGLRPTQRRLAVLGSPIAHSRSPLLHAAAYRELGLDWEYKAIEVTGETLAEFVDSRDAAWRGLSLTMPLKRDVIPLLDSIDATARLTGSVNTLVFDEVGARHGFNTDVPGITDAFARRGFTTFDRIHVLGGGATAATAIAASAALGARQVTVSVRSPERAAALREVGRGVGVEVSIGSLAVAGTLSSDAIISTLPNGVDAGVGFDESTRRSTVLFDVAYEPWPSTLASTWLAAGGTVIPGIDMLVHQALIQIRIFVHGTPTIAVDREGHVLAVMREAVGAPRD